QDRQGVRGGQRAGAEDAQRHQRRPVPRFDQREGGNQHGRAGQREDRLQATPAGGRRLDDRVDEQHQRAGDGQRTGGGGATPGQRAAGLAQQHRGRRERGHADGGGDEEDPLPAGAV